MTSFQIQYKQHESIEALPPEDRVLIDMAFEALEGSHAPYSNFRVGAAAVTDVGTVVKASNIENASLSLTNCAERILCQYARSNYPGEKIVAMAIVSSSENDQFNKPLAPCGACRQVLYELENEQRTGMRLLLVQRNGVVIEVEKASDLLPLAFGRNHD